MSIVVDLALQPIVNAQRHIFAGHEVLARFNENGSTVGPMEFISHASDWATLDIEIVAQLSEWIDARRALLTRPIFMNISAETLANDEAFSRWLRAVKPLTAARQPTMVFEVSEDTPFAVIDKRWDALKATGAMIAMDDIGEGHANLTNLHHFPWSFGKFASLEAAIRLAAFVDKRVCHASLIVECIETPTCSTSALDAGLYLQQRYLFAKPRVVHPDISIWVPPEPTCPLMHICDVCEEDKVRQKGIKACADY